MPNEEVSVEYTVAASGQYYFYAQNGFGNVTKSDVAIQATQVIYMTDDVETERVYLLGDKPLKLSQPKRPGFAFGGWFLSKETTGTAVTQLEKEQHSTDPIKLHAKWTREAVTITQQPAPLKITYDGIYHGLNVEISNTSGDISYQWYKNDVAIEHATSKKYEVKDVSDSGNYYVEISVTAEGVTLTAKSDSVVVEIAQAPLTVKAVDQSVPHGSAAPEYTVSYEGLVGGETAETGGVTKGTITCEYQQDQDAKSYAIIPSGFVASNYKITHINGSLTVEPIKVEDTDISASLGQNTYTYTGQPIEPVVTVTKAGKPFDSAYYKVTYQENVNVGTVPKAIVTFQGNYSGTISLSFEITKASFKPTVSLANWVYGETANTPKLSENAGGGKVTYYYQKGEETPTTQKPTAAGEYKLYAEIAATPNYDATTTEEISFTIQKRTIRLIAPTQSWKYDGNSHSNTAYTMKGSFAGSDGFLSIVVTGQITNVGEVDNVIFYTLSSSTVKENYDIICSNGKLTITVQELNVPVNHRWIIATPGMASWVAVTRSGLEVKYLVKLYRANGDPVTSAETSDSEYSFADAIKEDTKANVPAGYYFTVQAVPSGGTNQNNYVSSNTSDPSKNIYTAKVTVASKQGIEAVTIGGEVDAVLLQGESAKIVATVEAGYAFSKSIWGTNASSALSFGDAKKETTTIKVSDAITEPKNIEIWANAENEKPVITEFSALTNDASNQITFTLKAQDTKAVTAWMITTDPAKPAIDHADWQAVDTPDMIQIQTTTKADTYYAWVKDGGGYVVKADGSISVYEIKFSGGEGVSTANTPSPMLKVQNTTLTLPQNPYVRDGFSFKNWSGTTGIYASGGTYAANASDTLTAQWSSDQFSYRVDYYFMGTDGTYKGTPDTSSSFVAAYGSEVNTRSPQVQVARNGMVLDTSKTDSITVTGTDQVLKVYYKRQQYTITYSYQEPGKATPTTVVNTHYYEAPVTEAVKPECPGYTFVGWLCGEAGQPPVNMPNKNITATGSFSPKPAKYVISYYEKDLTGNGYTLNTTLMEEKNALHADKITFLTKDAKEIQGFSVQGVTATEGRVGESAPITPPSEASVEATVTAIEGNTLYINYYFNRNEYKLTLNVWKENRGSEDNRLYQKEWTLAYGAEIVPADYVNYDQDNWIKDPATVAGYRLAEYADWSTGDKPSAMPAGNITVSRDYVSTTSSSYQMQIFYETAEGNYTQEASLTYYGNVGDLVTAGSGQGFTIDYSKFGDSLTGFSYYSFKADHRDNITTGTVTDMSTADAKPLVLKLYFERKTTTSKIIYYYSDGVTSVPIGTLTKNGKWGTKYNHEPLMLFSGGGAPSEWTSAYTSSNALIDGTLAEKYDFKANSYVASYAGHYKLNGSNSWPGHRFTQVKDLAGTYEGIFGNGDAGTDYINVYYTKAKQDERYVLDVVYNPKALKKDGRDTNIPLTVELNGTTYNVRVANKVDVFEATFVSDTVDPEYPGLASLGGTYTYGNLKPGFTETTLPSGGTYYLTEKDGKNYLYVIHLDEDKRDNQFYAGNRTSYNFLKTAEGKEIAGYSSIKAFLEQYQIEHGDSTKPDYDDSIKGAYIENNGFSSIIFDTTKPIYYTFTFDYKETYTVAYNLAGTTCIDHHYSPNATVEQHCSHPIFKQQSGYDIVWYSDGDYKTKAEPFQINKNTTLYGRYERQILTCHSYVYYQLANALTADGKEIIYVTAENLETVKDRLAYTTDTTTEDFTDGAGNVQKRDVTVTTYTYKGEPVMIDREYPMLTFTEISMKYDDYGKEGFHYDTTNSGNRLVGYCQAETVPLATYFACNAHMVTVVANNEKVSNSQTATYRFGQTISLPKPARNGYTFASWTWYKWIGNDTDQDATDKWEKWNDAPAVDADGNVSFVMPALRLKAEANWTPAKFEQTITHYFQGNTQTYDAELLETLKTMTGITATVTFDGKQYTNATVYKNGETVLGISLPLEPQYTVWFSGQTILDTSAVTVKMSDLIAAEETVSLLSEATTVANTYAIPSDKFDMFSYSFTLYQEDTTVTTLNGNGEFTNHYGMQLNYYYTRANNYTIRAVAKAPDGGDPGTTLVGSSTHYYGEQVTLRANLSAGYDFKGWYRAADVLEGYQPGQENWSNAQLKSSITAPPISTSPTYTLGVIENHDLVVLTSPQAVSIPTVSITGKNNYSYGYAASPENALKVNVTLPDGSSNATYIAGYQWYDKNDVIIQGATSSTYLFPSGQPAGDYKYKCVVTVGRKDNGRVEAVSTSWYDVKVVPAEMVIDATDFNGLYDEKEHGITVKVKTPKTLPDTEPTYEIYYATIPLDADNYTTGKTTNITYKNVAVDKAGKPAAQTVYYYIHSKDGNFVDAKGQNTVTICPITLAVKAVGKPYSKIYDGKAEIEGDVTDPKSGKHELASDNYYTVSGLLGDDKTNRLMNFDAKFNSKDVVGSSHVTLSNIEAVDLSGTVDYNYTFTIDTELVISGFIQPFPLNVSWSTANTFTYDGTTHAPQVQLDAGQTTPDAVVLSVLGEQTNIGNYTAYAAVQESKDYKTSNYSFTVGSCPFDVTKRKLTIAPNGKIVTYDKTVQKLDTFMVTGLVSGQNYTASTDTSATNAGVYTVKAQNMQITADGKAVTDNYNISYSTGMLQIDPKPVTITGVTARNKSYDSNQVATLDLTKVTFNGLIAGDILGLDADKISGQFENANAGLNKKVTLEKQASLLAGTSAMNYALDWENSETQLTADITKADVTVMAKSITTVYGEDASFDLEYKGLSDVATITGSPKYTVRKQGETGEFVPYDKGVHGAGIYDIRLNISDLSADNYLFSLDPLHQTAPATLTVEQRSIEVQAVTGTTFQRSMMVPLRQKLKKSIMNL